MDTYGLILLIAMPVFIVCILIELLIYQLKKIDYNYMDAIASLYSGMTNTLKDVLGLTIVVISYDYLLQNLALFSWGKPNIWMYIITFIILDFGGYWYHRISHEVNYFWNIHVVHHSSEYFNLPCALRQQFATITNILSILITGIALSILGIPKDVIVIVAPLHLFLQFWYHTNLINKMGFLEYFLVTPSHHRVHHSMNKIYMDKNYSQIFIIWDKLFGTFQAELDTEKCIYGIRHQPKTWNPFIINFQHLWSIVKDAFRTKNWKDKLLIWIKPTGWRPKDVAQKYPIESITDDNVYNFIKYNPTYSNSFKFWSLVQLILSFLLMAFLFYNLPNLSKSNHFILYGLFLLFSIFSITAIMDKKSYGIYTEILRLIFATYFIFTTQNWFGINQFYKNAYIFVFLQFIISVFVSLFFYYKEFKPAYQIYKIPT
ncbi:MAG TPA: sterol desaturase family protein [Chitinophagales bacterium]|nr:sterol desaturase family protein [Chitinophagales bacterium]MCB0511139.1 sterol desaturase family protein [Bacteroidota bacterium]MCB0513804.1 sterol desaturase family protein [Bacteroidota bacterium]MCB9075224.1 sterol desaturase family protein [Chitinophagales bacterium]HMU97960.1 sterol desaturase family protein [Chitinophagales bacterium]